MRTVPQDLTQTELAGTHCSPAVESTADDDHTATRSCHRGPGLWADEDRSALPGPPHRAHQVLEIQGAVWVQHRDALPALRPAARDHLGDAVRMGNLRGFLTPRRIPCWREAASCIAKHPPDESRVSLTSAAVRAAHDRRDMAMGCWVDLWRNADWPNPVC